MTYYIQQQHACIVIASHISNSKRIGHLMECLTSLIQQSVVIPIYLSISFETIELRGEYANIFSENSHLHREELHIIMKEEKTPQMRHIEQLMPLINGQHTWVMFCDDDDTYEKNRVISFLSTIQKCYNETTAVPDKYFVGLYESHTQQPHQSKRQEYWCYCIHVALLEKFYELLEPYPDVVDNKCCDILLGEYLRRMSPNYVFAMIGETLYNYRVDNNVDSITGVIRTQSHNIRKPREITQENMEECAKELDTYLDKELQLYIHDTFLRTIVGNKFDDILRHEFLSEYVILGMVKKEHIQAMYNYHMRLLQIVNSMYHIKIGDIEREHRE